MRNLNIWWVLVGLFFLAGCSSSRPSGEYNGSSDVPIVLYGDKFVAVRNPLSLSDFLQRVPGVQVSANKVIIRGQYPPLFVIDDVQVGHSYDDAKRLVSVFDIQSVEVIRDLAKTVLYGSQGVNGVIIIRTWMPVIPVKENSNDRGLSL